MSSADRPLVVQILKGITTAVRADRATLTRVETGSSVVIEGSYDVDGTAAEPGRRWQITAPEFRRLVTGKEPVVQAFDLERLPSPFRQQLAGVRQMVTVPLIESDKVFATVAVSRRSDHPFDSDDLATLRELGAVAVMALRNSVKFAQLETVTEELKTSEERFRLMVQEVKDYAIFMLDQTGHVTSWNQGARRIKGYRAEEIIGRHFSAFYTAADVARAKPTKALAIAESRGRYEEEGWRLRKDGSRFFASVTITAIRDEAGRLRGFAKVTRDITERRRMQDHLLEAERRESAKYHDLANRLEALERTKSGFLNLASHELRTPVSLIRGYLSLFEEGDLGELNENGHRAVEVLHGQVLQLHFLIGQMLEAAGVQSGSVALRQDLVDLGEAAAEAVEWVRDLAGSDYTVTLTMPEHPVRVNADAERLADVLRNLLDNAVKYSPNGGMIACEVVVEPGWARFKVKDEGLGIDLAQRDLLFHRFGRVVNGDTATIGGAGLGLYLARELARLHGGDVATESNLGRGSTFVLSLPLGPGSAPNEAPAPATSSSLGRRPLAP
jgi:PAS domain S-box-containing protein